MILPDHYWIELDPRTGNPTGNVCYAYYYPGDKPIVGLWILVEEVEEPVKDKV